MIIENHFLEGVPYVEAASHGGIITPKFLTLHYTAQWTAEEAISLFKKGTRNTSAHLILDRDGSMTQMLPFNVKGHHAGASFWRGYAGLNSHSIGIEIVNYGDTNLELVDDKVMDRRRQPLPDGVSDDPKHWLKAKHQLNPGATRLWQLFTQAQFDILDILVPLLIDVYNIREVVGHDEIATPPGRKPDPGPAFPMEHYKQFADYANADAEGRYIVIIDDLNCRGGPGTEFSVIRKFKSGDAFKVLKFSGDGWALIEWGDKSGPARKYRGWVHESYIIRA